MSDENEQAAFKGNWLLAIGWILWAVLGVLWMLVSAPFQKR